jgi:hypothetical protein
MMRARRGDYDSVSGELRSEIWFATVAFAVLAAACSTDRQCGESFSCTEDTVVDEARDLTWQRHASPTAFSYRSAQAHCAQRGLGWRVPREDEWFSLMPYKNLIDGNTIHDATFPGLPAHSPFFSSLPSLVATNGRYADYLGVFGEKATARVLCVCSGSTCPAPR